MKKSSFVIAAASVIIVACASEEATERKAPERAENQGQRLDGILTCSHPICATGAALVATCDPCVTSLCLADAYCCLAEWDATCVGEVTSICGQSCTAPPPPPPDGGASTCSHPICSAGTALTSGCDPCVTQLCAQDAYCCASEWDATCVGEVGSICGQTCN